MATNTMDAIKKKMQAMKGEKDNALEKADQLEQRVSEQKAINEKVAVDHRIRLFYSVQRVGHTMDELSAFISVLCHSD